MGPVETEPHLSALIDTGTLISDPSHAEDSDLFEAQRMELEIGLDTFGDRSTLPNGQSASHPQVLRELVGQAVLADQLGLHSFNVGEHHREDFAITAPEVLLAAIAARTQRIKLGSAVTVLSTDDPIRVYERFSTLDALSSGRAEVQLGRGSFTESFPLFGFDLADYEMLFEEKLEIYAELHKKGSLRWKGQHRPPVDVAAVYPEPEHGPMRTWVGVGGTPKSVVRAASYGFGLMLAIIGGEPARFAGHVELFHRSLREFDQGDAPVGVHAPGYVAMSDEQARDELWPHFYTQRAKIGGERGWPPPTRAQFDLETGPAGALFVGSPETVAKKIIATARALGLSRFHLKYANGALTHEQLLASIELIGTRVVPLVREGLGA